MGIKRVVDVLLNAPEDLTAAERMVLVAIGENVRDGDPRRETWPDFNAQELAKRTGLTGDGSLKRALQRLAKRGLEVRIPINVGKDGRAQYARPGKQCRYRFPAALVGGTTVPPIEEEGGTTIPPMGGPQSPLGGTTVPPRNGDAFGHLTCENDGQQRSVEGGPQSRPTPPLTTPSPSTAPHEEDSPAPLTPIGGRSQQRDDDLAAAAAFLEGLPQPWTIGPVTAEAMAQKLLDMTRRQGWALDDALAAKLTENPGGIRSYPPILRRRIGDLPKRIAPAGSKRPPLPPWCGECADGNPAARLEGHLRQLYDDHGNGRPCPKCHPSQTSHRAA